MDCIGLTRYIQSNGHYITVVNFFFDRFVFTPTMKTTGAAWRNCFRFFPSLTHPASCFIVSLPVWCRSSFTLSVPLFSVFPGFSNVVLMLPMPGIWSHPFVLDRLASPMKPLLPVTQNTATAQSREEWIVRTVCDTKQMKSTKQLNVARTIFTLKKRTRFGHAEHANTDHSNMSLRESEQLSVRINECILIIINWLPVQLSSPFNF